MWNLDSQRGVGFGTDGWMDGRDYLGAFVESGLWDFAGMWIGT